MHIECTRHIDASEPDADGLYAYYYEYDVYRFSEDTLAFVARSYTDDPEEAHFLRMEVDGRPRSILTPDLSHPLFLEAQMYLRATGKIRLRWLSGRGDGYEPLPSVVYVGA